MRPSAEWIFQRLGLKPHVTCGFTSDTYVSGLQIPAASLPTEYRGDWPLGGVLYFLIAREAGVRLHRIRSDQMYQHYLGDSLEVLLVNPEGAAETRVVGSDLFA